MQSASPMSPKVLPVTHVGSPAHKRPGLEDTFFAKLERERKDRQEMLDRMERLNAGRKGSGDTTQGAELSLATKGVVAAAWSGGPVPVSPLVMPRSDPLDPVQLIDLLDINCHNAVETTHGPARQAGPVVSSNASTRPTWAGGQDALGASRENRVPGANGLQRGSRPRGEENGRRGRSSSPEVLRHRPLNAGRGPEPRQYAGQALEDRQHLPTAAAAAAEAATLQDVALAGSSFPSKRPQTYIDLTDESSLEPRALKPIGRRPGLPPSISPAGYSEGQACRQPPGLGQYFSVDILPFLTIGCMRTAQDERQLEATSVSCLINCSSVGFEAPDHYAYVQCALDDADTSLSLQRQKAMDLISSTRQCGGVVMLFQAQGSGKSSVESEASFASFTGPVSIMYLMWECRLTLLKAFALLHFQIPQMKISPRICAYLVHYEAILYGYNSMTLKDGILIERAAQDA